MPAGARERKRHITPKGRAVAAAVVGLTLAVVVPGSALSGTDVGDAPSCGAVTKVATAAHRPGPPRYTVAYRMRCNFRITRLSVRTSKALVRVLRRPALDRPDPEDSLGCARASRTLARCHGQVGQDVRIRGVFKVKGRVCGSDPVRARFRAEGGLDCDPAGTPCNDIGFFDAVSVKHPRGC